MSKLNWEAFEKKALAKLKNGEQLGGKDGVMAASIKHLLETEGFNRQIRKTPKSKGVFPSKNALMKLVWQLVMWSKNGQCLSQIGC